MVEGPVSTSARKEDRARQFRNAMAELLQAKAIIRDGEGEQRVRPTPKEQHEDT
jgi:hypothetical protein